MILERSGSLPSIAASARIAPTAQLVGNVHIGHDCVIDYGAVLASSGPPIVLARGVVVMANAVVRSVGGKHRPAFPVEIGADSLVGPLTALAGCTIGEDCYIATGAMVFQGATVGTGSRIGAGAIVHIGATLPRESRVGMRQFAVASGAGAVITSDLDEARKLLAEGDFFSRVFTASEPNLEALHRRAAATVRDEVSDWSDIPPQRSQ